MNKHAKSIAVITSLILVILIIAIILIRTNDRTKILDNAQVPLPVLVDTNQSSPITVTNLASGQTITVPMTVTGTVVGNWFFEGSFPVFMKDASGNQIGVGLASSTQDWMTVNTIPFSVTLPATSYHGQGSIVFTKDNPSGESQFDASYVVPVVFQ